ncbi:MAG: lipoyl(octanoyl) transferase LipB [Thermoanaerobacteraceae bacterium]|nr:lipoyl(octanoyl) transferase LipB [Thermoanaerobacteraceae bacterium]
MTAHGYFLDIGFTDYMEAYLIQQTLQRMRIAGAIKDTLILVEHAPVLTIGRSGGRQNILATEEMLERQGISVCEVERGGDITYHGPGQLVGYPIIDLKMRGRDLHRYVRQLEEVIIRTLNCYSIIAGRKDGYPGVWVGNRKIAALGVAVKKWVTMHGFALNITCNLEHFQLIVPCGISGYGVTSMVDVLGQEPDFDAVSRIVRDKFAEVFEVELEPVSLNDLYKRKICNH